MSIRHQLGFGVLLIVIVYVTSIAVVVWSDRQRRSAVDELEQSGRTIQLYFQLSRDIDSIDRQIQLMSGDLALSSVSGGGTSPEPLSVPFIDGQDRQMAKIMTTLEEIAKNQDEQDEEFQSFRSELGQLLDSWRRYFLYYGRDQEKALEELIINSEPLSASAYRIRLPALEERENKRMRLAQQEFKRVSELSDRLTLLIYGISASLLMLLSIMFSSRLAKRLDRLRQGADRLGSGELEYRIDETAGDELGALAHSFNQMGGQLLSAHEQQMVTEKKIKSSLDEAEKESKRAETLLLNILPESTARELKERGSVAPHFYEGATVMFADISGFTLSSEKISAEELLARLNDYFTAFDQIIDRYGIEKLKTIGDCYMSVSGVPERKPSHAVDAVLACMEMHDWVEQSRREHPNSPPWLLRIGLHAGPVVAGVVGIRKFAFDIWGSTVNLAARMESSGEPSKINVSESMQIHIKDFFELETRGSVTTKDKRDVPMFFVKGIKRELLSDGSEIPEKFAKRYRSYFKREPAAFPPFLLQRRKVPTMF